MANRPITITGINPADHSLILSDHGSTNVDPGDTVTWLIAQNSGVGSITSITDNNGATDVFNPDPAPIGGSSNWRGTVNPNIARGSTETYTIWWLPSVGNQLYRFDPVIQVNN